MQNVRAKQTNWTPHLILAVVLAAFGGLLFGHDTGVISGALLYLKTQFNLNSTLQESVTSTVLVGAVVGAAVGGPMADRIGRRKTIIAFGIIFCIGSAWTAASFATWWLFIGRFIVGFAIGGASLIAPLYISEISPKHLRGGLVSFNQVAITLGILLAYLIDYGFGTASSTWGWRGMFAAGIIPAVILAGGMFFMPESPRFLVEHGKNDQARDVVGRVRGESREAAESDVEDIRKRVRTKGTIADLIRPELRVALLVGVGLAVFQQITGINTIIYYSPTILQKVGTVGKSPLAAILGGAEITAVNFLATFVAVLFVDRVGRRVLLIGGMGVMAAALTALGFALVVPGVLTSYPWIVVALLMVYIIGFAIGLGPVFWLLIAEIYPTYIRGTSMSISTIANWAANLLVSVTFLTAVGALGQAGTFWMFAGITLVAIAFAWVFVPETKNMSLEQIEDMWQQRAGVSESEDGSGGAAAA